MVKKRNRQQKTMLSLAKKIYDDQRDIDTPPAEMEDVTELLLLVVKKMMELDSRIKTLTTEPL
jgi:hypothetical protein